MFHFAGLKQHFCTHEFVCNKHSYSAEDLNILSLLLCVFVEVLLAALCVFLDVKSRAGCSASRLVMNGCSDLTQTLQSLSCCGSVESRCVLKDIQVKKRTVPSCSLGSSALHLSVCLKTRCVAGTCSCSVFKKHFRAIFQLTAIQHKTRVSNQTQLWITVFKTLIYTITNTQASCTGHFRFLGLLIN